MPKQTFEPADYPRLSPEPLGRPVTSQDIADFFVNFMRTDILGMIATRHVTLADYKANGTLDPDCLTLASMHSTAVDFSKTGIPVDVKKLPKPPFYRPDFLAVVPPLKVYDIDQIDLIVDHEESANEEDTMGQAKHKYYKSDKILGRLYRNVDEKTESRLRTIQSSLEFQVDQLVDNVHRLEQRVLVAGKEADKVLSVSALRLRQ
ncbi:unnamed protein product, partial [Fusarium langsethiae]